MSEFTTSTGLLVRVGLYLLIFWPTVGYYIHTDAKKRGISHPLLRGIGFGFLGIIGLLIHFARRGTETSD